MASNLPGGRGMGEPLRLMVDIPDEAKIVNIMPYIPESEATPCVFSWRWLYRQT